MSDDFVPASEKSMIEIISKIKNNNFQYTSRGETKRLVDEIERLQSDIKAIDNVKFLV